ncbi:LisH domain-containing protein armc9 [Rhizophlyctis rosea]|nr:LisH domain-containing protein armc9 [Rhizophlyctis rosea]
MFFEHGQLDGGYSTIFLQFLRDPSIDRELFCARQASKHISTFHEAFSYLRAHYKKECNGAMEHRLRRLVKNQRETELAIINRKYLKSDYHKCLEKLYLVKEDPPPPTIDIEGSSDGESDTEFDMVEDEEVDLNVVKTALKDCYVLGQTSFAYHSVHAVADKCYYMLTNNRKHNCITSPDTTELEYRSSVVDFIFSELFDDRWLHYRSGEQHNSLIASDRALQQQDENARGPLHDGIGWALFDMVKVPLLLVEVVGGPTMRDAAKERTDCEKLLKGLATSVSVQVEMGKGNDEVLSKIRATGLLVYQTRLRVLEARHVDDQVVVKLVDDVMIPSSIQHWRELGRLMECLVHIKYLYTNHYTSTIQAFDAECEKKGVGGPAYRATAREVQDLVLSAFRAGDRTSFFELWDAHFVKLDESGRHSRVSRDNSSNSLDDDPTLAKLEFLCSIYFAVVGILPGVDEEVKKSHPLTETMPDFKHYLETRGSDICNRTSQFLPFYALPYVPDPRTHPAFGEVFEAGWWKGVEERVQSVIGVGGGVRKGLSLMEELKLAEEYRGKTIRSRLLQLSSRKFTPYIQFNARQQQNPNSPLSAITSNKLSNPPTNGA